MNLIALFLLVLVVGLIVMSYKRPAVGAIGLLALIPFYYVFRGLAGQSAFAFLWPYLFMAALTHVFGVIALTRSSTRPGELAKADRGTLAVLYGLLALATLIWWRFVALTFTQPVDVAIGQFNDYRLVVFGFLAIALVSVPIGTALVRQPQWIRRLTVLDWTMIAFLSYGGLQLLISLGRTRHLFYSLESFRYFFLMAWTYFVVRFGLKEERDAAAAVATIVGATIVVTVEFIGEHFLFNNGVSSLQLPWLRAFDSLFAGYGRPAPIDGFYMITAQTESAFLPYHGVRGIGLFMHPHTAGFFMMLGTVFVAAWTFDKERRRWPWLLVALSVLIYGNILTMSRMASVLLYAVLIGTPAAAAWALQRRFAWRRGPVYILVILATMYGASRFSPGGELPHFHPGWYGRSIVFSFRAVRGDLLAWNTPETRAVPAVVNRPKPAAPALQPAPAGVAASNAKPATPAPQTLSPGAPVPGPTVATTAKPPASAARTVPPAAVISEVKPAAAPAAAAPPAPTAPTHDTSSISTAASEGARALASKLTVPIFLFGRGFSPLTRYVVDFFPEAAEYRHVYSTSDVALLEFFQQFGAIGLGLLLLVFGVFAFAAVVETRRWAGRPAGAVALCTPFVVAVTIVGLLHLYPLFRIGVNTSIYALLGVFGFLCARRDERAAVASAR